MTTNSILLILFASVFIVCFALSAYSFRRLRRLYKKFGEEYAHCGMTGLDFCKFAIPKLRLFVNIGHVDGELSDCYSPKTDIIYLTSKTANTCSVASICICAHELGHAVQKRRKSKIFRAEKVFVTICRVLSFFAPPLVIAGLVMLFVPNFFDWGVVLLLVALGTAILTYCCKIITIPVESEASKIAYNFLKDNHVLSQTELKHAKKMLNSALSTYFANLFSPIFKLFHSIGRAFER